MNDIHIRKCSWNCLKCAHAHTKYEIHKYISCITEISSVILSLLHIQFDMRERERESHVFVYDKHISTQINVHI